MKIWIIATIITFLLIAGTFSVMALTKSEVKTTDVAKITSCSSCGGKCTAENNCGSATCGAASAESCGCGKNKG